MPRHPAGAWSLLSSHGAILVAIAEDPARTIRAIAERAGLTERRAAQIVRDLEAAGYLVRQRTGRRIHYTLDLTCPTGRPPLEHLTVGEFLAAVRVRSAP